MNLSKTHFLVLTLLTVAALAVAQTTTGGTPQTPAQTSPAQGAGSNTGSSPQAGSTPSTPAPSGAATAASTPPESNLAANTPVITIQGVCEVSATGAAKPATTAACRTQITRAEFEKLVKGVAPNAPATARRQIANQYAQLLIAANQGEKLGLEKDPDFKEQLAILRLQLLAQATERKLRSDAANVSDADIKTYYEQNPSAFEEVQLTRVFVPRSSTEGDQKVDTKAIADNVRQTLVSGGDPDKLQKAVFDAVKTTAEVPTTKFGPKRRGTLPPAHETQVFSLKPGEVSQVIPDSIGFVVYRLESQKQLQFDEVKDDVKRRLTQQRLQDESQRISSSAKTELNEAYFGPASPPPAAPGPPGAARGTSPPSTQSSKPPSQTTPPKQ